MILFVSKITLIHARQLLTHPMNIHSTDITFQVVQAEWSELWALVDAERGGSSLSTALKTGNTSGLAPVRKPADTKTTAATTASGNTVLSESAKSTQGLLEYFTPTRISRERQAQIDLLLFKLIICCALPFSLLGNTFFIEFVLALAPNYKIQERTSFFAKHITAEVAAVGKELKEFLSTQIHMTASLDGWSSRAKDEIYTVHATIPSRRSFFVDGHVFKGVSVTGAALCDVLKRVHIIPSARLNTDIAYRFCKRSIRTILVQLLEMVVRMCALQNVSLSSSFHGL